jgi:DNA polymerase-3 subunit alpha
MAKHRTIFAEGAATLNVDAKTADDVFSMMEKFAGYGFNKSHSAAYSVVAYQTAYLKAHYPAEFMAAVLTTEMADSAKLATALEAARATGIEILPPCVNRSNAHFTVEDGRIRFGLGAIKGAGHAAIEALVEAREAAGGTFTDPFHLAGGLDLRTVGKKTLEVLASAGAMDAFEGHRAQFVAGMDTVWAYAQRTQQDRLAGQSSLFGGEASTESAFSPALPHIEPWGRGEQLRYERDLIGFYVSGHPLDDFAAETAAFASIRLGDGANVPHESDQTVIGMITEVQHRTTKSGRPMAYATLEDATGAAEVVFFAQTLERAAPHLVADTVVMVRAKAETGRGDLKLLAREVVPMWKVRESLVKAVVVRVDADAVSADDVEALGALCDEHRGACKLYFELTHRDLPRPVRLRARTAVVDLTADFLKGVAAVVGRDAVVLEGD